MSSLSSTSASIATIGIIIPPPEIRAVVDKTAQFVAKSGLKLEERILNSPEGRTPKFNFLKPDDPYHPYYRAKITEITSGVSAVPKPQEPTKPEEPVASVPTPEEPQQPEPSAPRGVVAGCARAALVNPMAKYAQIEPTEAPNPLEFVINHPINALSPADLERIRLTAQFTAVNGRQFLSNLAAREHRNPLFDFLRPTHVLFTYFTALVDSYVKLLSPSPELRATLVRRQETEHVLEEAIHRWNWRHMEEEKANTAQMENTEKLSMNASAAIDWHDFVVVEVIDFPEDDLLGEFESLEVGKDQQEAMEEEDEEIKLKVVSDYKQRIVSGGEVKGPMTVVDPVSGKRVAIDQLEEHMRVQLIDPRWRDEQRRFADKQKETGFAEGADIAANLMHFAQKRAGLVAEPSKTSTTVPVPGPQVTPAVIPPLPALSPVVPPLPTGVMPPPLVIPTMPAPVSTRPLPPIVPLGVPQPPQVMMPPPQIPHVMSVMPPPPVPAVVPPPAIPPPAAPTTIIEEQVSKKPRMELELIPADEFAAAHPDPFTITIIIPSDPSVPQFDGRTVTMEARATDSVRTFKELMCASLLGGIPATKIQLKSSVQGFLKDVNTFAAHNIGLAHTLEVSQKSRGGKR